MSLPDDFQQENKMNVLETTPVEAENCSEDWQGDSVKASRYLGELLMADPFQPQLVRDALDKCDSSFDLRIDKKVSQDLEPVSIRKIVLRILGTCFLAEQLCKLMFSLADGAREDGLHLTVLEETFENYICVQYRWTARRFLAEKIDGLEKASSLCNICSALIARMDANEKPYDELPKLKELKPSTKKMNVLMTFKQREQRQIHRIAEGQSIVRQLFKPAVLKYGKAFTTQIIPGQYLAVTHLQEHSISLEFPWSELYDPLQTQRHLRNFLRGAN